MCEPRGKTVLQYNYIQKDNGLLIEAVQFCYLLSSKYLTFTILTFIFSDTICTYMNAYTLQEDFCQISYQFVSVALATKFNQISWLQS